MAFRNNRYPVNGRGESSPFRPSSIGGGVRSALCFALFFIGILIAPMDLFSQTYMTGEQLNNMLPDKNGCNGNRSAVFWRKKPTSEKMVLKIFLWVDGPKHPLTSPSFTMRKFINGAMQDLPPSDPVFNILPVINDVTNYVDIPNSPWAYVELPASSAFDYSAVNPVKYELVNSVNVFHLAIGYASAHSPSLQYELLTRSRLYTNPNVLKISYSHDKVSSFKELVGDDLAVCRKSSIELSARYEDLDGEEEDPFDYLWEGGGISPADAADVVLENVVLPGSFTVKREGFCNFSPSRKINVKVLEPIEPVLEADEVVCKPGQVNFVVKNVKDAKLISWSIYKDKNGNPTGSFEPIPGMQDLPNSGSNEVTQPIQIDYVGAPSSSNSIVHRIQVIAANQQCEGRFEKDITVFQELLDPVIEVEPTDPNVDPKKPVCSPFYIKRLRDTKNVAKKAEYRWEFNNGIEEAADEPQDVMLVNKTQTPEVFNIKLSIDPGDPRCVKQGVFPITLNPYTPADMRLADLNPLSGCSPVTIEASDITEPAGNVGTREWTYTYDGTSEVWGTDAQVKKENFWFDAYDPSKPGPTLTLKITNKFGCTSEDVSNLNLLKSARAGELEVDGGVDQCSPTKVKVKAPDLQFCSSYFWEVREVGAAQFIIQTQEKKLPLTSNFAEATFELENNDNVPKQYEIIFHAKTPHSNCVTDKVAVITVNPSIKAELLFPKGRDCPTKEGKVVVKVEDKSVRPTGVVDTWTLDGNPITMSGSYPNYEFTAENLSEVTSKTVELKLHLDLDNKCSDEASLQFEILPRVNPTFTAEYVVPDSDPPVLQNLVDGAEHCAPLSTKFVGSGAQHLRWRLKRSGDADVAFGENNVEYVMRNPSSAQMLFTMYLIGENSSQCKDSVKQEYKLNPGVEAEIGLEVLNKCNPVEVRITSNISSGSTVTPTWDYDGGVYNPSKGVYVYNTVGQKTIKLTVQNQQGCSAVATPKVFDVPELIVAKIDADIQPSSDVCAPETVTFKNGSTGATEFAWDFGDGSPVVFVRDASAQKHEYKNTTDKVIEYKVKLTGDNGLNCADEPQSVSSVTIRVYPTGALEPSLSIEDPCNPTKIKISTKGASKFDNFVVDLKSSNPAAGADIHEEYYGGQVVKEIILSNSDPNNALTYSVKIKGLKSWGGGIQCPSQEKSLKDVQVPPKVSANIVPSSSEICSGDRVSFTDNTQGGNISHEWDFGDASGIKTSNRGDLVDHQFINTTTEDITYIVKVKSSLNDVVGGCPQPSEIPITVHPEVIPDFKMVIADKCVYPLPVSFTNRSKGADPMSVQTKCNWDYGYTWNGVPQKDVHTSFDKHTFYFSNDQKNVSRSYIVSLTVTQEYGGLQCSSKAPFQREIVVPPELIPNFEHTPDLQCSPMLVNFKNKTTGGEDGDLHFVWHFGDTEGDHTKVTTVHAQHEYDNASKLQKDYTAKLVVTNQYNCVKEYTSQVKVLPRVQALFSLNSPDDCTPIDLTVHNASKNAQEFLWELEGSGITIPNTSTLDPFTITIDNDSEEEIKEYTLRLKAIARFTGGVCEDSFELPVTVHPKVKAIATPLSPLKGCNPLEVKFEGKVTGHASGRWDFGDGRSSASLTTTEVFTNDDSEKSKDYKVTLRAERGDCTDAVDLTVTVLPLVEARFETTSLVGCTPLKVGIVNKALSSVYEYEWEPGAGLALSTASQPESFTYENTSQSPPEIQTHKLKLTTKLRGNTNCSDSKEVEVTVYPAVYPSFAVKKEGCHPFQEKFTNNTIAFPGKMICEWKFGDIPSQEMHPKPLLMNNSHVDDEVYNVTLKVTSIHGCTDSFSDVVTVHPVPKALFHLEGANESCPPFDVTLINESLGTNTTYEFDFDDGVPEVRTDLSSVTHQYNNTSGDKALYNIKLTATSQFNCSSDMTSTVTVFPGAVADFSINPGTEACSPFLATMANNSKNGHKYVWDFGDGKTSNMESPAHQFENLTGADKTFDVHLKVETENECNAEAVKQVIVWATPIAAFSVEPPLQVFAEPSAKVQIIDKTKPQVTGWNYEWAFGDGTGSVEPDPGSHEYAFWGPKEDGFMYKLSLKVSNAHCQDTTSRFAFVLAPVPSTDFIATSYGGCAPFDALFENLTQYADSCRWNFGDGESSTDNNPVHRYKEPNLYHVKLTSWGQGGSSYAFRIIEVYQNPVAKFEMLPEKVMIPKATVKANNLSLGLASSYWDFGDGFTSEEHSPVHKYDEPGEYKVKLRVESDHGCVDETELDPGVLVLPGGKIEFPNAFSPSADGPNGGVYDLYDMRNQVFHPVAEGVVKYRLTIYNRWGEQIFQSDDINIGWDGYHLNKLCDVGVYAWRATGHFYNGELFDLRGNVTLLR